MLDFSQLRFQDCTYFPSFVFQRYTPFGSGLATVIAPHLSHDADHSLFLWDATCCLDYPLHCFFGHRDVILDFDWRKRGDSFQLVSCGLG